MLGQSVPIELGLEPTEDLDADLVPKVLDLRRLLGGDCPDVRVAVVRSDEDGRALSGVRGLLANIPVFPRRLARQLSGLVYR